MDVSLSGVMLRLPPRWRPGSARLLLPPADKPGVPTAGTAPEPANSLHSPDVIGSEPGTPRESSCTPHTTHPVHQHPQADRT